MNSLKSLVDRIKYRILGSNYERIDYLVDSFSKLSPRDRKIAVTSLVVLLVIILSLVTYSYFSSLNSFEKDLIENHKVLSQIMNLSGDYTAIDQGYRSFVDRVRRVKRNFNVKSFINTIGNRKKLRLDFDDVRGGGTLPMAMKDDFFEKVVKVSINKISLKQLVDFLKQIESSRKYLKIKYLELDKRYDNKQYFRVNFNVASLEVN